MNGEKTGDSKQMRDMRLPAWYRSLNKNERAIIDLFVRSGIFVILSRQYLERSLCGEKGMDPKTLTDRLKHLIDKGILFRGENERGAVIYGPNFILEDPNLKQMTENLMDNTPAGKAFIGLLKVATANISKKEMIESIQKSKSQIGMTLGVGLTRKNIIKYDNWCNARIESLREQIRKERESSRVG